MRISPGLFPLFLAIVFLQSGRMPAQGADLKSADNARITQRFDSDWRFKKGEIPGAETLAFMDNAWRSIELPHDWSIEDLPASTAAQTAPGSRSVSGPFDSDAPGALSTGFTIGGIGWYRKHFTLPAEWEGKIIKVQFDGVYMNADVWINGHHLGNHPYGYTSFTYDLTQHLHFGNQENVISVEVKNVGQNSRWYSGSGLYRHVWLTATEPLHIGTYGTFVTTPQVETASARVCIKTSVENSAGEKATITLVTTILDPESRAVSSHQSSLVAACRASSDIEQDFDVKNPRLWSTATPCLYRAVSELMRDGKMLDRYETVFGIRSIRFDPEKGFFLNGRGIKLRGGCVHSNNGPLGAAAFDRAEERRVELLKAAGFNAVRCAHNPPSPAFLDACDRLGMLVIDEAFDAWTLPHAPITEDYHLFFMEWWRRDLASMLQRDRNHPSIILWSIGNQITDSAKESGARTAQLLAVETRTLDPTRPVTSNVLQRSNDWHDSDPFFAALDVAGYSYARKHYDEDHQRLPNRIIFSSEIDPANSFINWISVLDRDFVCGNFEWTAFDYMGEAGSGWWSYKNTAAEIFPWNTTYCGDIDICGFKRPRSYYRDALWNDKPTVSAFVHCPVPSFAGPGKSRWGWDDVKASWTWPGWEGKPLQVDVYSSCESVQLTLNNKVLGTKPVSRATEFKASWQVPYEPGSLVAIGCVGGKEVARWELLTAGQPAHLHLTPDRPTLKADGQDLCYVTVEIVDRHGVRVPDAALPVDFAIAGEGTLAAVSSSKPDSIESFQQPRRITYDGRCLAIIRTTRTAGNIALTATAEGLSPATVNLLATPPYETHRP